jgi:hypothetical protein
LAATVKPGTVGESAGRICPLDYHYDPAVLARAPQIEAGTLIVVGGLYGNRAALAAVEALAAAEPGARLVFNGDFHWFDAEPAWFADVETRVAPHVALRGNVETELAREGDASAGCGCAYPPSVDDGTVARSNAIAERLAGVAAMLPGARARLGRLPMHLVARVGEARIGIVHGDAGALAGWRFDIAALDDPAHAGWLAEVQARAGVDVFACTHTCLPALRRFETGHGAFVIANNGAAGMPNAAGSRFGIVTRISTRPGPVAPLFATKAAGVRVEALPLAYDHDAFWRDFSRAWPEGSPAWLSYAGRILDGPSFDLARAAPGRAPRRAAA